MKEFVNDIIDFKAGVFIIPNMPGAPKNFILNSIREQKAIFVSKIFELNGMECADPMNEVMVEVWVHSKDDLGSENLGSHGFPCIIDGEETYLTPVDIGHIPVKFFEGHKEGDEINIKIPVGLDKWSGDYSGRVGIMDITMKLDQTHYRYAHRGPFEQCLTELLVAYNDYYASKS